VITRTIVGVFISENWVFIYFKFVVTVSVYLKEIADCFYPVPCILAHA